MLQQLVSLSSDSGPVLRPQPTEKRPFSSPEWSLGGGAPWQAHPFCFPPRQPAAGPLFPGCKTPPRPAGGLGERETSMRLTRLWLPEQGTLGSGKASARIAICASPPAAPHRWLLKPEQARASREKAWGAGWSPRVVLGSGSRRGSNTETGLPSRFAGGVTDCPAEEAWRREVDPPRGSASLLRGKPGRLSPRVALWATTGCCQGRETQEVVCIFPKVWS